MIDKSKPFYICRTAEFGNGEAHYRHPSGMMREVPEVWRAKQTLAEAAASALQASAHGKEFFVYELRLVGRTPIRARRVRKAKRGSRKVRR